VWAAQTPAERDGDAARGLSVRLPGRVPGAWRVDPDTGSARVSESGSAVHQAAAAELAVCAACHSRRGEIAPHGGTDGRFLDHYMPALLTEGLYHADGQIEDEVFVWGSFVQSRMHEVGVGCSDCHEPHSLALRAPGAAVCGQCHLPARYAGESHHHHAANPGGPDCLDCHMPESTYMVVDPRRDHSLRIPRPDLTETLGVPNACNGCHEDRTAAWAAGHYREWYVPARLGQQTWAAAFSDARAGNPAAESALVALAGDATVPDIARATAVLELAPLLSPRSGSALEQALKDPSPLVRIGALRALEVLPPAQRYPFVRPLLADPLLAVRSEAGRMVSAVPQTAVPADDRSAWREAVADYVATQTYNADRPEAQTNLASLYAGRGEAARAQTALRRAIELDPHYAPAYANLADLLRVQGQDAQAIEVLQAGLAVQPDTAALHHALGLAEVRAGELAAALQSLRTAWQLAPDEPRFAYVYAIAQNGSGAPQAGRSTLREALQRHPYDRDLLLAVATISRDLGDLDAARRYAQRMVALRPDDAEAVQLAQSLGL
jgi:tetratricopeptide (TPR) repeat protein